MARFKSKFEPFAEVEFTEPMDIRSMQLHPDYVQLDEKGNLVDNSLVIELSTTVSREPPPAAVAKPKKARR